MWEARGGGENIKERILELSLIAKIRQAFLEPVASERGYRHTDFRPGGPNAACLFLPRPPLPL